MKELRIGWGRRSRALILALGVATAGCGSPARPSAPLQTSAVAGTPAPPTGGPAVGPASAPMLQMSGTKPSVGSEVVVSGTEERISFTYDVAWSADLPDARVWVYLVNAAGSTCTMARSDLIPLTAGRLAKVELSVGLSPTGFGCDLPSESTVVRAALVTQRPIGDGTYTDRITYLTNEVAAPFRYRRYPAPPEGVSAVAPAITQLKWHSNVTTCSQCFPLYGEVLFITCTARAADGDALTSTVSVTWSDRTTTSVKSFPAGASSSAEGASFLANSVNRMPSTQPLSATAVCTVTNTRGETATQTLTAKQ